MRKKDVTSRVFAPKHQAVKVPEQCTHFTNHLAFALSKILRLEEYLTSTINKLNNGTCLPSHLVTVKQDDLTWMPNLEHLIDCKLAYVMFMLFMRFKVAESCCP